MNLVEMLTRGVGTQHEVVAWFTFDGKRYAARYITDAVHIDRAREYMLKACENTRAALEWHKAHDNWNWPGFNEGRDVPMLCEHAEGDVVLILRSDFWK